MSFNGEGTKSADNGVTHEEPEIPNSSDLGIDIPKKLLPIFDPNYNCHEIAALKHPGGAAGQGPSPPEPPVMETEDEAEITIKDEEGSDVSGDDEENSDRIMMF